MQRLNLVSPPRPIVNVNEFRKISFEQDIIIGNNHGKNPKNALLRLQLQWNNNNNS